MHRLIVVKRGNPKTRVVTLNLLEKRRSRGGLHCAVLGLSSSPVLCSLELMTIDYTAQHDKNSFNNNINYNLHESKKDINW
eukprot:scaffold912_cov187-Ochromonas_danica.AAC.20